jgi:hypothetical protein
MMISTSPNHAAVRTREPSRALPTASQATSASDTQPGRRTEQAVEVLEEARQRLVAARGHQFAVRQRPGRVKAMPDPVLVVIAPQDRDRGHDEHRHRQAEGARADWSGQGRWGRRWDSWQGEPHRMPRQRAIFSKDPLLPPERQKAGREGGWRPHSHPAHDSHLAKPVGRSAQRISFVVREALSPSNASHIGRSLSFRPRESTVRSIAWSGAPWRSPAGSRSRGRDPSSCWRRTAGS